MITFGKLLYLSFLYLVNVLFSFFFLGASLVQAHFYFSVEMLLVNHYSIYF